MARKTKPQELGSVVLAKDHIKRLYRAFAERRESLTADLQKMKEENQSRYIPEPTFTVTVNSAGRVETQAEDDSLFDHNVLDDLKTNRISIAYSYSFTQINRSESASITIAEGPYVTNLFTVSGNDPAWVDSFYNELSDIVKSIPPQRNPIRAFRGLQFLVRFLITALFAYWYLRLIEWIPNFGLEPAELKETPKWLIVFAEFWHWAKYLFAILFLYMPAGVVISWFNKAYPDVEFNFGPEHLNRPKQQRIRFITVGSLIVLPFVLQWLFTLISLQ